MSPVRRKERSVDTHFPIREKAHDQAGRRGSLGRRLFLAMLLAVVGGIVIGMPQEAGSRTRPTLRGCTTPATRQTAVAGALHLDRPANPVPSRVGGALHLSSERAARVALQ
jgi:hypothetical protein